VEISAVSASGGISADQKQPIFKENHCEDDETRRRADVCLRAGPGGVRWSSRVTDPPPLLCDFWENFQKTKHTVGSTKLGLFKRRNERTAIGAECDGQVRFRCCTEQVRAAEAGRGSRPFPSHAQHSSSVSVLNDIPEGWKARAGAL